MKTISAYLKVKKQWIISKTLEFIYNDVNYFKAASSQEKQLKVVSTPTKNLNWFHKSFLSFSTHTNSKFEEYKLDYMYINSFVRPALSYHYFS